MVEFRRGTSEKVKEEVKPVVAKVKPAVVKKNNLEARVEAIENYLKVQFGFGGTNKKGTKIDN